MDKNDPILGFFVRWVAQFAKHFESVIVICLEEGEHDLPENVRVFSLGKKSPTTYHLQPTTFFAKLKYIRNFYKDIFQFRKDYDTVFVHMNSIYVVLGGLLWKLWRKKVALWYNHTHGRALDRLAFRMADRVLHTSPFAFSAKRKKSRRMPAGIDTEIFRNLPNVHAPTKSILYVGRIAPVKHVDVLLQAAHALHEKSIGFTLDIYGEALPKDAKYFEQLKKDAQALVDAKKVFFRGSVPNSKTPEIYNAHEVFVNLTPAGNYDKTVLEAMACGCNVVASSEAFSDVLPSTHQFEENNATDLADTLQEILRMPKEEKQKQAEIFRAYVGETHSLQSLTEQLHTALYQ